MDTFAVDRDLELMRILEPAHRPEVGPKQPDLELILAIERERRDTYANERPAKGWTPTPAADGTTWITHAGPLFFGLGYDIDR